MIRVIRRAARADMPRGGAFLGAGRGGGAAMHRRRSRRGGRSPEPGPGGRGGTDRRSVLPRAPARQDGTPPPSPLPSSRRRLPGRHATWRREPSSPERRRYSDATGTRMRRDGPAPVRACAGWRPTPLSARLVPGDRRRGRPSRLVPAGWAPPVPAAAAPRCTWRRLELGPPHLRQTTRWAASQVGAASAAQREPRSCRR